MCYVDNQQAAHAEAEGNAEWLADMADYTAELSAKQRCDEIADGGDILPHETQILADLIVSDELWRDLICRYLSHCRLFGDGEMRSAFINAYKEEILKSRKP